MVKSSERRYLLVVRLNTEEKEVLRSLETMERLPASQLIRRLIWQAKQNLSYPEGGIIK